MNMKLKSGFYKLDGKLKYTISSLYQNLYQNHLWIIGILIFTFLIIGIFKIDSENYIQTLQNLQLGLLSLLITLGIELYRYVENEHPVLQEMTLREFFNLKIIIGLIFISALIQLVQINAFIILIISLVLNLILAGQIITVFNFLNDTEKKSQFYKKTLSNYDENKDKLFDLWQSYWSTQSETYSEEKELIAIFQELLNGKITRGEFTDTVSLLREFHKYIDKRSFLYQNQNFIRQLFKWRFYFFDVSYENRTNSEIRELNFIIDEILINSIKQIIGNSYATGYEFFTELNMHLDMHKDKDFNHNKNYLYESVQDFCVRIITLILDMEDWQSDEMLHAMQFEITKEKLSSDEYKTITYFWFNAINQYIHSTWKQEFTFQSNRKINFEKMFKVNRLINNLIPDINPKPLIDIIELSYWNWKINDYIQYKSLYFLISKAKVTFETDDPNAEAWVIENQKYEKELAYTIDFIIKIFGINTKFVSDIETEILNINKDNLNEKQKSEHSNLQEIFNCIEKRLSTIQKPKNIVE